MNPDLTKEFYMALERDKISKSKELIKDNIFYGLLGLVVGGCVGFGSKFVHDGTNPLFYGAMSTGIYDLARLIKPSREDIMRQIVRGESQLEIISKYSGGLFLGQTLGYILGSLLKKS